MLEVNAAYIMECKMFQFYENLMLHSMSSVGYIQILVHIMRRGYKLECLIVSGNVYSWNSWKPERWLDKVRQFNSWIRMSDFRYRTAKINHLPENLMILVENAVYAIDALPEKNHSISVICCIQPISTILWLHHELQRWGQMVDRIREWKKKEVEIGRQWGSLTRSNELLTIQFMS